MEKGSGFVTGVEPPPLSLEQPVLGPPVLDVRGLCKSFGSFAAVRDLNLTLKEGEIYGFLGRNGAGKTTTIRMLMGVVKPRRGTIRLFDEEKTFYGRSKYKQRVGYISQVQYFYPWMTCAGIGKFVGGFYKTWDRQEYAGLLTKLDLPPKRKVSALSHGMKTKLALALALAHRPPLLILDEPTAGLDPVTRRDFLEMILVQKKEHGRTVIFSTHLLEDVERTADTIGVIAKGCMRYEGPLHELKRYVRRVTPKTPDAGPETLEARGLEVLRDVSGEEGRAWFAAGGPAGWRGLNPDYEVEALPLEDVFVELSGKALTNL
ncbi:MAG: ABC transporter ATP-binding protein [Verrucomicrobiota bacterium]